MCTTWLIPFPGLLNQNPKRAAADCKKDGHPYSYNPFEQVMIDVLNGYFRFGFFSSKASNSSMTSVPVAS
jgi:hypothetical protein